MAFIEKQLFRPSENTYTRPVMTHPVGSLLFRSSKRGFDVLAAIALLPFLALAILVLLVLNPRRNPGPLFFAQTRVGRNGMPFRLVKFRTMVGDQDAIKFADQEQSRITPFGMALRNKRVDELPQILNVLRGEMSFVGPRPEQVPFVEEYCAKIPAYAERHLVRPGISGLAQVEHGYTSDVKGTRGKLKYDLIYIRQSGFRMEAYVIWRTLITIISGFGAK